MGLYMFRVGCHGLLDKLFTANSRLRLVELGNAIHSHNGPCEDNVDRRECNGVCLMKGDCTVHNHACRYIHHSHGSYSLLDGLAECC